MAFCGAAILLLQRRSFGQLIVMPWHIDIVISLVRGRSTKFLGVMTVNTNGYSPGSENQNFKKAVVIGPQIKVEYVQRKPPCSSSVNGQSGPLTKSSLEMIFKIAEVLLDTISSLRDSRLTFNIGQITKSHPRMPNPYRLIPLRGMIR